MVQENIRMMKYVKSVFMRSEENMRIYIDIHRIFDATESTHPSNMS